MMRSRQARAQRSHPSVFLLVMALLVPLLGPGRVDALFVCGTYALQQDETHETVTIGAAGKVDTNGHTLTITGSGGLTCQSLFGVGGDLCISGTNGKVVLSGGGTHSLGHGGAITLESSTAVLQITSSATIIGRGEIIGKHPAATISIASGKKLTSGLEDIRGTLTISGPGTFKNEGVVRATADYEAGDTLTLAANLKLMDTSDTVWMADDDGILELNHVQTGNNALHGMLSIHGLGTLHLKASISVLGELSPCDGGTLDLSLGTLLLDEGVTLTYSCYTGSCPNPGWQTTPYSFSGPFDEFCF